MAMLKRTMLVIALLAAAKCDGPAPTAPRPSAQPSPPQPGPSPINEELFEVTGIVTDHEGAPVAGAVVTMAHWLDGRVLWPSVMTDGSGTYRISFAATMLPHAFVARAQVVADGYEEYWRSLYRSDGTTTLVGNFRLSRITRITAGDSIVLSVAPDVGECPGDWDGAACTILRILIPKAGRLTIEAAPNDTTAARPPLEVCCDRWGNPITVTVTPGDELVVKIGVAQGISTTQSIMVKTSFETP